MSEDRREEGCCLLSRRKFLMDAGVVAASGALVSGAFLSPKEAEAAKTENPGSIVKIGIIQCSTVHREVACASFACFKDLHAGRGAFARYAKNGQKPLLAGFITCAKCPTAVGFEKFLRRVRPLVSAGAKVIHFTSCMSLICPWLDEYLEISKKEFPDIEFVAGTHQEPPGLTTTDLEEGLARLITAPRENGVDMVKKLMQKAGTK